MAAWPGSLPAAPLMDDFGYEPMDQCVSTDMDLGPPQRRRRFSVAFGTYRLSFNLTGTQRAAFETFYVTTLGGGAAQITGFADPRDGTSATFQFAGGTVPQWQEITPDATPANRLWRLTVVWERVL